MRPRRGILESDDILAKDNRKKDEPDDRAEWPMISLTASISMQDEVLTKDSEDFRHQLQARRKKGSSKEKEKREESHKVTLNLDDIDKIVLTFTGQYRIRPDK